MLGLVLWFGVRVGLRLTNVRVLVDGRVHYVKAILRARVRVRVIFGVRVRVSARVDSRVLIDGPE